MLKTKFILFLLFISIVLNSCDIIDPPYRKDKTTGNSQPKELRQGILLEDFTGHTCVNCPDAHRIAKSIYDKFPKHIVILSIHVGSFAEPTKDHPYDFRTPVGNIIGDFFNATNAPLPVGMINRIMKGNSRLIQRFDWESEVKKLIDSIPPLSIKISPKFNASNNEITVDTEVEYHRDGATNHRLILFISEDSIVSYQKGKPDKDDYVHNHVLRASITNPWGEIISNQQIKKGDIFKRQFKYIIPPEHSTKGLMYYWRPEKLNIIALVHDYEATYYVLNVTEKALISD